MNEKCYVCGKFFPPLPAGKIDYPDSVYALIRMNDKMETVYTHYECAQRAFDGLRRDLALPGMYVIPNDDGLSDKFIRMGKALDAVLLFHSGSPWTDEKRAAWRRASGQDEATTKVLCDVVRLALHDFDPRYATDGKQVGYDPIEGWSDVPDGVRRPIVKRPA